MELTIRESISFRKVFLIFPEITKFLFQTMEEQKPQEETALFHESFYLIERSPLSSLLHI